VAVDGRYLTRDEITQQTGALHLASAETRVSMETAGGGGFGAPHERPRELIERDVRDGLVTEEMARRVYGDGGMRE
jgi:N-methylhydantoinase B